MVPDSPQPGPAASSASGPGWPGRVAFRLPWWVARPVGRPAWAWRTAMGVTGAILLVPILLVVAAVLVAVIGAIVAILAGMLTYVCASAIAALLDLPGRLTRRTDLPAADGRRNVRVLDPEEGGRNVGV